ncbi:P27 family phage terminase small subunit [Flagellimonas sp. S174]|uniref:P27 family phage terminase small subunit n=1 Tax=Flagellimonas sp. S174 TaxID=3410790 RepID=UPI003BF5FF82
MGPRNIINQWPGILIKIKRLKGTYLPALEVYAESMALWEFTCRKIREADRNEEGSGYFQTFSNNVTQNSTWLNQQNAAIKRLFDCFKQFGLEPSADKNLKNTGDSNQTKLFNELANKLKGA